MKRLLIVILIFSGFAGQMPKVYAEEISLAITPPNIVIQTEAPAFLEKPIKIINKNDRTITLDIIFASFTQNSSGNGKVSYILDSHDPDIFNKISILDDSQTLKTVILSPGQEKTLMLQLNVMENEPNSDYYFSILFVSKDNSITFETEAPQEGIRAYTKLEGAIGINVLLSIFTGEKKPEGFIDAYHAPLILQSGPVPFEVTFKNTGNYLLAPEGTILLKNMFGQIVGRIIIPKTFVLGKSTRVLSGRWEEHFLFGPYTAELLLTVPDTSISFRRTTTFVAAPVGMGLGIIVIIIGLVLLRKRVRKYLI